MTVNEQLTALADEVRALSGETSKLGLAEMTNNVDGANTEVSTQTDLIEQISTAISNAHGNYQLGYEDGQKAEHDQFWNGYFVTTRVGEFMFAGKGWNDDTFRPPVGTVIQPTYAYMMFAGTGITDLVELCNRYNVVIDFSKSTSFNYTFYTGYSSSSFLTHIGEIDTTSASTLINICYAASRLRIIDKFILKSDGTQKFGDSFRSCSALENITIEGVIGQNGLNFQWSTKLTHDSLISILNALKDYSADTSGTTYLITLGPTNLAKLTNDEIAIAEAKGWEVA